MLKIEEVKTLNKIIWTGINHEIQANEEHDVSGLKGIRSFD